MKKFKNWLINRFLSMWAKETVLHELQAAYDELEKKDAEITQLRAYIDGYRASMRAQKRIVIYNGEVKK